MQASLKARESDLNAREEALAFKEAELQVNQEKCDIKHSEALQAISECKALSEAMKNKEEWMSKTTLAKHVERNGKTGFINVNVLQEYIDSMKPKMSQADINKSIAGLEDRLNISNTNTYGYSL